MTSVTFIESNDIFAHSESSHSNEEAVKLETTAIEELAEVFRRSDDATLLVERAGFPRARIPTFGSPLLFWTRVAEEARSGALHGGLQVIIEAAARMYPANQTFANAIEHSSRSAHVEQILNTRNPTHRTKPHSHRWFFRTGVIVAFAVSFIAYHLQSQATSIIACTIRIEDGNEIGRGWVMHLDSGAIYSVDINGADVSFRCPPEGCDVAFVVDLNSGEIRHWANLSVSSAEKQSVSLKNSTEGAPADFIRQGVVQGILNPDRFDAENLNPNDATDTHCLSSDFQDETDMGMQPSGPIHSKIGERRRTRRPKSTRPAGQVRIRSDLDKCQVSIGSRIIDCGTRATKTTMVTPGAYNIKWRNENDQWINAGPVHVSSNTIISLELMESGISIRAREEFYDVP